MAGAEASDAVMMSCELKELGPVSEIMKLLECPICKGLPIPPIWNCDNGHISCDQCKSQLDECGLCRAPFAGGRNFFMEGVVNDCLVTCPYAEVGCGAVFRTHFMKNHAAECKFGPKIKWISCQNGNFPPNAIKGGRQHGVDLFIIRAPHMGSTTPGKLYEFAPPGVHPGGSKATLAWGGGERHKFSYEVLVAPLGHVSWVTSQNGDTTHNAVIGGVSETGETLYIGRFLHEDNLINGKIHPSHRCCYIGVNGREIASSTYEILVKVDLPPPTESNDDSTMNRNISDNDDMPAYYS
ncbi:uncharacterized protein LOC110844559 [Folsomia candida]|nr:uncharacterized protein LOC110844559 [Folsomia candida]